MLIRIPERRRRSRWYLRGISIAVAAIAIGLLAVTPVGTDLEETVGLRGLFHLRGPEQPPPGVAIVAIDKTSATALDLPSEARDWPRDIHARLIDALREQGAVAVVFDLLLSEKGKPSDDLELVRALQSAGNVALLQGLERRALSVGPDNDRPAIIIDATTDPAERLSDAAVAVAAFPLPRGPSQVTRFWTFRPETDLPTLPAVAVQLSSRDITKEWAALLAAELHTPQDPSAWTGKHIVDSMSDLHREIRQTPAIASGLRRRIETIDETKRAKLAALVALYEGDDDRLLDFRGPPGTVQTVEYSSIISQEALGRAASNRAISGKIVFVGDDERFAVRHIDSYDTVFSGPSGINLAGVEILATATADLLESSSLRTSTAASLSVVVVTALLLGLATASARTSALIAVAIVLPFGIGAVAYHAFASSHLVLPVAVPVGIEVPVGLLSAVWWLRMEERRRRISMDEAIRQYLPEEVARSLDQGPLRASAIPPGETRYAVCLATDAENFTTLSERLSPAALGELLNDYLRVLFEVIKHRGGVIENVTGDGLMSVWSTSGDSAAVRASAATAAMEIRDAVALFNQRHPDHQLPTRIGLHAGTVLIGAIGGAGHYTATVVGDVANTASRVEALNKHLNTRLLASREALEGVEGLILRPLGGFVLVGKSQTVHVVEILGLASQGANATTLSEGFAKAMAAFRARSWQEATDRFNRLLQDFPEDGPTAFFLKRSLMNSQMAQAPTDEVFVRMDEK